jgi:hypothetical protein
VEFIARLLEESASDLRALVIQQIDGEQVALSSDIRPLSDLRLGSHARLECPSRIPITKKAVKWDESFRSMLQWLQRLSGKKQRFVTSEAVDSRYSYLCEYGLMALIGTMGPADSSRATGRLLVWPPYAPPPPPPYEEPPYAPGPPPAPAPP